MLLSLIVAASENNVIGKDNTLPWHLPDDLKRFRALTKGHPVIMGRKTFDSIGHPLPDRLNIVVSRHLEVAPVDCVLANSLSDALQRANAHQTPIVSTKVGADEIFVIGGSELFALALPFADRLYLTRVHAQIDGDVSLPAIDFSEWSEISREEHPIDPAHAYSFSFIDYERKKSL